MFFADCCCSAVGNNPAPLSSAPHRKVWGFYFSNLRLSLRPGPLQTIIFWAEKVSPDEQYSGVVTGQCVVLSVPSAHGLS
jgi:hypothetical protein